MAIPIKNKEEIKVMKEGVKRLRRILRRVLNKAKPGIRLSQLDRLAESLIEKQKGLPSFKMVPGYEWVTCINVNQGVVHGIPDNYRLKENDVVCIEKLNSWNSWRSLNRSMRDVAWLNFFSILKAKAEEAGRQIVEVPARGTSQICSGCEKEVPKDLSVRVHNCPFCHLVIDRDYNSALNILRLGASLQGFS